MKSYFFVTLLLSFCFFSCGSSSNSSSGAATQNPHAKMHQQMHNELYQEEIEKELVDKNDSNPKTENISIIESDHEKAALLQSKWKEGIVFYASAPDSSWILKLHQSDSLSFYTDNKLIFSSTGITLLPSIDPKIIDYRAVNKKGEIIIQMVEKSCGENNNGEYASYEVNINLKLKDKNKNNVVPGCGDFIPDPLLNGNWLITDVNGAEIDSSLFVNKKPMISIDLYKKKIYGNDGCNAFQGQIKFKVNKMIIGPTAGTLMACPNMDISNKITGAIGSQSLTYKIDGSLTLYQEDKKTMVLKRKE